MTTNIYLNSHCLKKKRTRKEQKKINFHHLIIIPLFRVDSATTKTQNHHHQDRDENTIDSF